MPIGYSLFRYPWSLSRKLMLLADVLGLTRQEALVDAVDARLLALLDAGVVDEAVAREYLGEEEVEALRASV